MKKYLELIIATLLIVIGVALILYSREVKQNELWERCKDNRLACYMC